MAINAGRPHRPRQRDVEQVKRLGDAWGAATVCHTPSMTEPA
jgi:hypothetical protein